MSECALHKLTFGPTYPVEPKQDIYTLSGKPADVADLECPACGAKLFVYYRIVLPGGPTYPKSTSKDEE